ncbi:MAG: NCS2 family permease [Melioribacteraceae bacterium]|nr:NCS2 family permease [Melioribacteraceae bacterium]MCF8353642.1 NCS2 family permease [Melioribacteraceae bacterium]MCF8393412.1 NCS2 family permease [Melioribacteraceae bacterium]MCF8419269.1 NCS2 family permease [Melioribacteraceae bacterium]
MLTKYFKLDELGTNIRTEIIAGLTTFVTMAYIIVVNPKILEAAGMPFGPSMVATILSAFFGTLTMGVYAKRPFAIAPYMGENAFIANTVVNVLGYSWQTALGAIFISGVIFTILTVLNIRSWLANAIPESLKIAFAVGIGLFLTFIGLNETGIVELGVPGAPVHIGNLHDASILLALFTFLFIGFLMIKKIKGAILIGILTATFLGFIFGVTPLPEKWVSMPPDISPIFLQLDILGALSWGFFAVILTVLVMDFVDTMGTLIGMSYKAGLLDEEGNLPEIEKPFLADALATVVAACLGTTTTGAYLESAAGIEAGGKSGLTSVVTAFLFLIALFFAPFVTVIPPYAYGSALIIVGLLMISPISKFDFSNLTEAIPVFVTITFMSFTFNLGIGLTAGFVVFPLMKTVTGNIKDVKPGMWVLFVFSMLFYVFYPY